MPTHREEKFLPYSQEKLYDLVCDIQSYPLFLPWCVDARILEKQESYILADLYVGYQFLQEKFTSHVHLTPKARIDVQYHDGPFHRLENHWVFHGISPCETKVEFYVDFEFKSYFFQGIMERLFSEIVHKMVSAFEKRAIDIYGK